MSSQNLPQFVILSDETYQSLLSSDCNCACPQARPLAEIPALPLGVSVQCHSQLQYLWLTDDFEAAFVPSASRVVVVNTHTHNLLESFRTPQCLADVPEAYRTSLQQLYKLGLLVDSEIGSQPLAPAELIAWLHVTNACNLRCTYCYIEKSDEAMSVETADAAIDAVLRSARIHGYPSVLLKYAGGEASLNLNLVEYMHQRALAQAGDIIISGVVLSNGVGLTRQKLMCIQRLGLRLMISLDGSRTIHDAQRPRLGGQGSYEAVIASIERARMLDLDLTVSVTITPTSIAVLPELVSWLLERKIHFTLNFYRENDCSMSVAALHTDEQYLIDGMRASYAVIEQNLPHYSLLACLLDRAHLGVPHKRTCAVGENYMVIDQHGNISKCQMDITHIVSTVSAADPLNSIRLDTIGVQNLSVDEKQGCATCSWRYWCAGGCAIATFRATGRYDIKSPNCAIYQALYPDVLRLEGKRLLQLADAKHYQEISI